MTEADQRSSIAGQEPVRRVRVVVLREGSRAPVAGCRVKLCDLDELFEAFAARATPPDQRARHELFTERAIAGLTDSQGEVLLPLQGMRQVIEASHSDGLWGRRVVEARPDVPVEISVSPDRALHAFVRSSDDDRPISGIPVVLCADPPSVGGLTEFSGADGSAVFHHLQQVVQPGEVWHLGLGFPVCDSKRIVIRADEVDRYPVELLMPPTGSLTVQLLDEAERPVPGDAVSAEISAFTSPARFAELGCQGTTRSLSFDAEGYARLEHVGLDLPLRITLTPGDPDSARPARTTDVDGPMRPGETVQCKLLWPTAGADVAVSGRFVRHDGTAWPSARIEVHPILFPPPSRLPRLQEIEVADGGRFRIVLHEPYPDNVSCTLRVVALAPQGLAGIEARLHLPTNLAPGDTDLGDVLLDRGAVLVAGEVVDGVGAPLDQARVVLQKLVRGDEREHWPIADCTGGDRVAGDGSFILCAIPGLDVSASKLRFRAQCPGYLPADLDVALGQRGLRVVLQRGGGLAGSVQLAPGQDAAEIAIVLQTHERKWTATVRADGSFERDGLPPGDLNLIASLGPDAGARSGSARIEVEGLQIIGGDTNRDARIQGLEIPDDAFRLGIEVVDASGRPVARAIVESSEGALVATDARGIARVRALTLPVEVDVRAFGYRTQELAGVSGDQRIVLREAPWIRLVTDAQAVGHDPDYVLGFRIRPIDAQGRLGPVLDGIPAERMRFGPTGEVSFSLPGPGAYSVEPTILVQHEDGVGRSFQLPESAVRRITVVDVPELQTVRMDVDQALIEAILRRE